MGKNFDNWNEYKKGLDEKPELRFVLEREIWWCSLGLNVGREMDGKHENFERPVLIVKKFNRDLVVVVPFSSKIKSGPFYYPYSIGQRDCAALLSQLRVISTRRLLRKIEKIEADVYSDILERVRTFF